MSAPSPMIESILYLENETWQALQTTGRALLPYLSDDCVMQFPLGLRVSEYSNPSLHDVLQSEAFIPWKTYKMSGVNVTPLGPDGAIISYHVEAYRPAIGEAEEDDKFTALISSGWRKDPVDGRWLMCFHQQTPF